MPPSSKRLLPMNEYILTMSCADAAGIIHRVTGVLFSAGFNITEQAEYVDKENQHFFMRAELEGDGDVVHAEESIHALSYAHAKIHIRARHKKNVVMLVGREAHCPGDILIRNFSEELDAHLCAVASNHGVLESLINKFGVPFHAVPSESLSREAHEEALLKVIKSYSAEVLVLAKYMRVLSPQFLTSFGGPILNIHHSFLPAFVGSKPYHRAHERGVKIIGATAHFVTKNLDEGPIVAQDVISVSHRHSVEDFIQAGHDVEKIVLARALRLVLADRVMVFKNRTIIFD